MRAKRAVQLAGLFRKRTAALAVAAALIGPGLTAAQTIDADRPGLLYGLSTLGAGQAQLELGTFQLDRTGGEGGRTTLITFPSVLRVGLSRRIELQVGHPLVNHVRESAAGRTRRETGLGDLSVALKTAFAAVGRRPAMVAVATLGLPTGEDPFTSGDSTLALQVQAGWTVGERLSLGALVGYKSSLGSAQNVATGALAVSLGASLNDSWTAYGEAGYFPEISHSAHTAMVGGGVTRVFGSRLQLDVFLNRGLNNASVDWTAGAGLSVRF